MRLNGVKALLFTAGMFLGFGPAQSVAAGSEIDVSCIQAVIDTRDTALSSVVESWASTMKQSLEARRDALKESWGMADYKSRRVAQRKAWNDYRKILRQTNATKVKERSDIWKKFEHERRECKGAYSPEMVTGSKYDATL